MNKNTNSPSFKSLEEISDWAVSSKWTPTVHPFVWDSPQGRCHIVMINDKYVFVF